MKNNAPQTVIIIATKIQVIATIAQPVTMVIPSVFSNVANVTILFVIKPMEVVQQGASTDISF